MRAGRSHRSDTVRRRASAEARSGCHCTGSCYTPPPTYYPPVAYRSPTYYPQQPYVSLSQVPYTGLELGPVGTVIYWSFLVLFSLFAAYLIAVKRVQVKLYRALNRALFGSTPLTTNGSAQSAGAMTLSQSDLQNLAAILRQNFEPKHTSAAAPRAGEIDEFVLSQINRVRAR